MDPQRRLFLRRAGLPPARPPTPTPGGLASAPIPLAGGAQAPVTLAPHCLAQRRVECRLCGDACAQGALRFVPALGGVSQLSLNPAACTGCGDCVPLCPVQALSVTPVAASTAAACGAQTQP